MESLIIFEYFTANPQNNKNIDKSVLSEGKKMINKLAEILSQNTVNVTVYVIKNQMIKILKKKNISYLITDKKKDWFEVIKNFDKSKTKVILIAPETGNLLYKIAKKISESGFKLLNSDLNSLLIFSSKLETSKYLKRKNIPFIKDLKLKNCIHKGKNDLILKPEHSAGSENIFLIKDQFSLIDITKRINYSYIIQKYYKNHLGSFSMLCRNGSNILLTCNKHIIKLEKNKIKQLGSEIGAYEKFRNEFQKLADQISHNFQGLLGFIGVDVIMDKKVWKVLEVNSRLTSSFVHLNRSYDDNIFEVIKTLYLNDILDSGFIPKLTNVEKVEF